VIAEKNPRLLKIIPGFVLRYLKRIVHMDELNDFVARHENLYGLDFADAIIVEMNATINVKGNENIPEKERFIIASNHPLGGPDGVALITVVGRRRSDVIFPVNDILMNIPNLKELFVPINKHGSNVDNLELLEKTFASDVAMLYFPAGLCSRKQARQIVDLEWKKTFLSKAKKHDRLVVPVHIDGRNTNFFYNLSNIRKKLGIKANIEMLYLVDEMYKQKGKTLTITIGKPIPPETFDSRYTDKVWAGLVKKFVYQLQNNNDLLFEDFLNQSNNL
jgi:putative hemolysin